MLPTIVGAVVCSVVILAVVVPIIDNGVYSPSEVENDPMAYTVYMTGDSLSKADFDI
jgi:hypothetical protein